MGAALFGILLGTGDLWLPGASGGSQVSSPPALSVSDKKTERQHGVWIRLMTPTFPPRRSGAGRHLCCGSGETSAAPPGGSRSGHPRLPLAASSGHSKGPQESPLPHGAGSAFPGRN